jgi:FKBP-type peptidyl-prolyl cis-trans isomerase
VIRTLFRRLLLTSALVALPMATATPASAGSTTMPAVTGSPVTTPSGLQYWDVALGIGATAVAGKSVTVDYTGWLESGKKFDSSLDRHSPITVRLGVGQVIKGWDEGVAGMKVGGKRRLRIPPNLAYGVNGHPPVIPRNATLVFDVELLAVK